VSGSGPGRARTVVFVLAPGLHLLDLAGPAQVFSSASDHGAPYSLSYVGDEETVATHQGLPLQTSTRWPDLGADDLVVVPGWRIGDGPPPMPLSREMLGRIADHHERGGRVVSVCAGAFALARAGLLDGRRATTHHDVQEDLARLHPRVHVVEDVLYVSDDRVYSSAGIASGIDLALHLVALDHGPAVAARVARTMVVYARRNGSAAQASAMLRHRDHLADVVHRAQDVIDAEFRRSLPLGELASSVGVSERTLTRSFKEATGTTPLRYQQELRVERAGHLVEQGWTHESAAHEVGFSDARMLRRLRHTAD
jgi:transcriptional regulator GlxA family with amidase domain